jgi:hypothetical protein
VRKLLIALLLAPTLAFALLVFLARPAAAQNVPLFATGVLTPGHAVALAQTGFPGSAVVQDAGPALAGGFTELGITNNGTPFCIRDLSQTHLLCLGANANGGGVISYNPIGAAAPQGLTLVLNGVSYPFPGPNTGLGTMAQQNADAVDITGGTLNGTFTGNMVIGADQFGGVFGTVPFLVGTPSGLNSIVGQTTNNLAADTLALPAGVVGGGKLTSNGNQVFGVYGVSECHQTLGGVCPGAEFTARNFTSNAPDRNLPPNTTIGTSTTVVTGTNITCGAGEGETQDCSIGINISNEQGNPALPVFNTGEYIGLFRQYGLFIDAQATGDQTSAVIKNNGVGINLQLNTSGTMSPANSVITVVDTNSIGHFSVRQNGDTYVNTLQYNNHNTAPTLSACGTGASLAAYSTDAHGTVTAGSGATGCVVNFGTAFTNTPTAVVTGENTLTVGLTGRSTTSISVGGAGISGATFDYIIMSNGS